MRAWTLRACCGIIRCFPPAVPQNRRLIQSPPDGSPSMAALPSRDFGRFEFTASIGCCRASRLMHPPASADMLWEYLLLCVAAALGGAVNSVAGGGTLLTFPSLFAALGGTAEAAVIANATSTVALFPGSLSAAFSYRRELAACRAWLWLLFWPSLLGGAAGALLLTRLPAATFERLIPALILAAAAIFAAQPWISRWLARRGGHARLARGSAPRIADHGTSREDPPLRDVERPASLRHALFAFAFQFLVAIYGGYFGAGIGILMLAALGLVGLADIHRMNLLKTLLAAAINGTAVVVFVWQQKVHWPFALAMAAAASLGGYAGAHLAQLTPRLLVRGLIVAIGVALGIYYAVRQTL